VIATFDLKDGAQFITDDRLNMTQRISVLELVSKLIEFDNVPTINTDGVPEKKSTMSSLVC
jgi:hypothetical protein